MRGRQASAAERVGRRAVVLFLATMEDAMLRTVGVIVLIVIVLALLMVFGLLDAIF